MKKLSLTLATLLLASGAFAADPPGAEAPKKSEAELLYEKLFEANTKQADAAYVAYLKALEAANQKILAGLEGAKKDLNNPKKGNLSITERAAAIAEIDKKIEEVKKGAVGEAIVAGRSGDLLGDGVNIKLAEYGIEGRYINCTKLIKEKTNNGKTVWEVDNGILDGILGDPAPGKTKNVRVTYVNGTGEKVVITVGDKSQLSLN